MSAVAECRDLLSRLRVRVTLLRAAESALMGLTLGMAAALPLVGLSAAGLSGLDELPRLAVAASATAAGAVMGLIWGLAHRPTAAQAAAFADGRAGLRSVLSAAAELADPDLRDSHSDPHPFAEWTCRAAVVGWRRASEAGAVRLRQRSELWERSAAVVGLLLTMAVLLPRGLFGSADPMERLSPSATAELGRELERQARELSGGGGVPDSAAVRAAIEQLLATGQKLAKPELPPNEAELELRRLDAALAAALARLPTEPISDAERARWEAILRRLRERLPSGPDALGEQPRSEIPMPAAKSGSTAKTAPTKPDGSGSASSTSSGHRDRVTGSAGGAIATRGDAPATSPTLSPEQFRAFWDAAQRAAAASSASDAADVPADQRELIRRFRR